MSFDLRLSSELDKGFIYILINVKSFAVHRSEPADDGVQYSSYIQIRNLKLVKLFQIRHWNLFSIWDWITPVRAPDGGLCKFNLSPGLAPDCKFEKWWLLRQNLFNLPRTSHRLTVRRFSFSLCYAASALITENARDFSFFIRKRKYDDILSLLDPILYSSLESQDLFGRYVRGMGIEFVIINCAQPAGEFPN